MGLGLGKGEGRVHDAASGERIAVGDFGPGPEGQDGLVLLERAVAQEQTDQIALGQAVLAGPGGQGAMVAKDQFVAGDELCRFDPGRAEAAGLAGGPQHLMVAGQAQAVAFAGGQTVNGLDAGDEKAVGSGRMHGPVEDQGHDAAGQLPGLPGAVGGHDPGVAGDAWISRFDGSQGRGGVVPVDAVEEDDARIAGFPGLAHEQRKDLGRGQAAARRSVAGVDEVVVLALFHGLHEAFGQRHRDVEVGQLALALLAGDKFQDVGMVDAQDAHVGPAPRAALFDLFGGGIENPHEGDRPGGHAAGGADPAFFRAQPGEGKARAAAGFVDERGELHGIEDLVHGVANRQHETGGQLAQGRAGVHEGGRIGQKAHPDHKVVEFAGQGLGLPGRGGVLGLFAGDGSGHPPEKALDVFLGRAVGGFFQIALGQDHHGVVVDVGLGQIGGQWQVGHRRAFLTVFDCKKKGRPPEGGLKFAK